MGYGFRGNIARVDLSSGKVYVDSMPESFYRRHLGGRGFVLANLIEDTSPSGDALSPERRLIFAPGVLTGTRIPGSSRSSVGARSPLTGGYGEAEAGGRFGARLKQAAYDAVVITGKASEPVWLRVSDRGIEIESAKPIWGRSTGAAQEHFRGLLGHSKFASALIGPAGENLVRYASVIHDLRHAAGRAGMGAVMGSKNMKGIVILESGAQVPVADELRVKEHINWLADNRKSLSLGLHDTGTAGEVLFLNSLGALPTRNFGAGKFAQAEAISGERMRDTILAGRDSCFACPIACKRVVTAPEYAIDGTYGGPEYETVAALGSNCGVGDIAAVAKAHDKCNAFGLDTISTGSSIAFAFECYERGLITERDTGGLALRFGDEKTMLHLIDLIAERRGIGAILAEGVQRAAGILGDGAEELALHVKGQEVPMHDPRLKPAVGLAYAVSPTGADHNQSIHDTGYWKPEGQGAARIKALGIYDPVPMAGFTPDKVRLFAYQQWWQSMLNCVGMCNFLPYAGCESGSSPADSYSRFTDIVNAVTGWNCTDWELLQTGKRMITLCRYYNNAVAPNLQDGLPSRFYEPLGELSLNEKEVRAAIELYYDLMDWDHTGKPRASNLAGAGVESVSR